MSLKIREKLIKIISVSLALVLFIIASRVNSVNRAEMAWAQEKPVTVCPIEKEVPAGQILDQTTYTANKILDALRRAGQAALSAMRAAKTTTELGDSCEVSNCESSCRFIDVSVACAGTPATSCTPGYSCNYQGYFQTGQEIIDNNLSRQDCDGLLNNLSINPEGIYGIFKWRGSSSSQCNPYSCPDPSFNPNDPDLCSPGDTCDYQGYTHAGQEIIDNGFSRQDCANLPSNLAIKPSSEYAIYQWAGANGSGWCNIEWPQTTCYGTCYDSGWCNVDWTCTQQVCQSGGCSGQACNFTQIDAQKTAVTTAKQTIDSSRQTIFDTMHQKVAELPLLSGPPGSSRGVCEIPGLGILCSLCNIPGLGNIVSGCKTEPQTILAFLERGIINARWCWNDPADYGKIISGEKSGKFLLRCQDVTPALVENCYPDNYFCCY